jgi:hypothetical protein
VVGDSPPIHDGETVVDEEEEDKQLKPLESVADNSEDKPKDPEVTDFEVKSVTGDDIKLPDEKIPDPVQDVTNLSGEDHPTTIDAIPHQTTTATEPQAVQGEPSLINVRCLL